MNIFKGLDLVNSVPGELCAEVHNIVQETEQNHPKTKEKQEGKMVIWEGFTNNGRAKRSEKQGRDGKINQLNAEFQRQAKRSLSSMNSAE